jgi:hypothetical protein
MWTLFCFTIRIAAMFLIMFPVFASGNVVSFIGAICLYALICDIFNPDIRQPSSRPSHRTIKDPPVIRYTHPGPYQTWLQKEDGHC